MGRADNAKLTELENSIYAILRLYAMQKRPCPSNAALMRMTSAESIGTTSDAVKKIERAGLIRVVRFQRQRVCEIVKTGDRTSLIVVSEKTTNPHVPKNSKNSGRDICYA